MIVIADRFAVQAAFRRFVTVGERGRDGLGCPIARSLALTQDSNVAYADGEFGVVLPGAPS